MAPDVGSTVVGGAAVAGVVWLLSRRYDGLPPGGTAGACVAAVVIVAVAAQLISVLFGGPRRRGSGRGLDSAGGEQDGDDPPEVDPLRWSLLPSNGLLRANMPEAVASENNTARLKLLVMHKPTHDARTNAAGNYPYSWHLHNRKRLWEVRVQVHFKVVPVHRQSVYFGLEMLPGPQSSGYTTKRIQKMILAGIQGTIGKEFYQTAGDDPEKTSGEVEPPCFAMPLWAVDAFHVADPGSEPDLTSDMSKIGHRRTDGTKAYIEAMKDVIANLSADKVYTFCFWGVSQFVDANLWMFQGLLGLKMDANNLCGRPPIFVVAYELLGDEATAARSSDGNRKHYNSQKNYFFKVALWSKQKPPEKEALRELLGDVVDDEAGDDGATNGASDSAEAPRGPFGQVRALMKRRRRSNQDSEEESRRNKHLAPWVQNAQKLLKGCMGS